MKYTTRMDVIQHNIRILALHQRLAVPCSSLHVGYPWYTSTQLFQLTHSSLLRVSWIVHHYCIIVITYCLSFFPSYIHTYIHTYFHSIHSRVYSLNNTFELPSCNDMTVMEVDKNNEKYENNTV